MFYAIVLWWGYKKLEDVKKLFNLGVEKVAINTSAAENPKLIEETAKVFGNQSIVVSIDVKKNFWGKYEVYTHNGKKNTKLDPVQYAVQMESLGAGEIFLNSIDKDGTMKGYDIKLIQKITSAVTIPVIACGGAGNLNHFSEAIKDGGASAVSAGSYFVFQGKHRAVLINFLSNDEINLINNAKL
nr:HisA/HisF-related TIM barrel protein [Paenibacillus sp. JMULE4]